MSAEFVTLIIALREAQREAADSHNKTLRSEAVRLEARVDAWLEKHMAEKVQLDLWSAKVKGSEAKGVYNVEDESHKE